MTTDEQPIPADIAALRAIVAQFAAVCPMCGRSLAAHGGAYARDALTGDGSGTPLPPFDGAVERVWKPADDAPPSGWRERDKLS